MAWVMQEDGWTLKEGCDDKRCSDKSKTSTQEDADACCDFLGLDQSIKTKRIIADKAGWDALDGKTWAEKMAWVMQEDGWTLKEGCDDKRCSDKSKTSTQEDADACCDFLGLDQSIK